MKLKGVNPIEQHIEKMVLGLVLVVFLGVIAMQFVTKPNTIEDSGRKIEPAQVYTALEPQANQLQSQITDLNPTLPEVKPVDLVQRYDRAFASAGGGRLALSAPLGSAVDVTASLGSNVRQVDLPSDGPVPALAVPRTSTPVAAAQWATLDPYALQAVPEYADFVPDQQPYDFGSISVQATFSGTELRSVLNGEHGGAPIPRRFWTTTGIAILGFEVERQKLMPDGSWGPAEPIVTPPHTPTPTRAVSAASGLQQLVTVVGNAARASREIIQPEFPPTIAGPDWIPPSDRVDSDDDSLSEQVRRLQRQLDRAQRELERLTGAPRGSSKVGTPPPGRRPGQSDSDQNRRRVELTEKRIEEIRAQLRELGVDDDRDASPVRTSGDDIRSVLDEQSIDLWAHDLGVEPGATYRYRTRVVVNNPLFRKQGELDPDDKQQQALAREPFARSDWSDWSAPVVAGARDYYFVTSTSDGAAGSSEPPKVTIELFHVYYGHYRKSTLSISPGDPLVSDVRISGELLAFDPEQIDASEAAEYIERLGSDDTPSDMPEGISELPSRISIDLGVYVLDMYLGQEQVEAQLGGQASSVTRVILREKDGELVIRSEQQDEVSQAYALASASAAAASQTPLRAPGEQPPIPPAAELFEPVEP